MDDGAEGSLLYNVSRRLQAIIFVLGLFFAIGRIRQYLRLRHFAGPRTTGFSWLWHSRAVIGGESPKYYGRVCEEYGMHHTSPVWHLTSVNLPC
jgi:hypothetical protein